MTQILVTEGADFIGFHLCEQLLKEGNRIIGLDNFLTGSMANYLTYWKTVKYLNISQNMTCGRVETYDRLLQEPA